VLGAGAALLAALCWLAAGTARAGAPADYRLVDLGNFQDPVHVDNAPGANDLLFVVSRAGKIRVLKDEEKVKEPFLDIRGIVQAGGEEGLLSVAFDPGYAENRRFYVYYVGNDGDIRIDQFKRKTGTRLRALLRSRREIIEIEHDQASNHNGGQLQFGPDGNLYAAVGDGGPQGDPEDDAQNPESLLGKLIRVDPQPGGGYASPASNPFVGVAGADEIYAMGLRNPWRFSFDSETGALTLADVGGQRFEEVNYLAGPSAGLGANFGWNDYEAFEETTFGTGANASPHTQPIADFSHDAPDGFCSIVGGYVVRDGGLPSLVGRYVFSDFCRSQIFAMDVPTGAGFGELGVSVGSAVSFGEGRNGQIYVVDLNGDVFRLEEQE
jgi:hypothetical protein